MKKLLLGTIVFALAISFPVMSTASVDISVGIGIGLPPPIVLQAPPTVIVLPEAPDVYVVPHLEIDLFFWNGWWWRPWEGHWYRSRYYDRGWAYYQAVPVFYYDVDPGWRGFYRARSWYGHHWDYQQIPVRKLKNNWRGWQKNRYWERQRVWNVQSYQPRPQRERQELRTQRQEYYKRAQEVRQTQQPPRQMHRSQEQHPYPPQEQHPRDQRPYPPQVQRPQGPQQPPPHVQPRQEEPHQPWGERGRGDSRNPKSQGRHGDSD